MKQFKRVLTFVRLARHSWQPLLGFPQYTMMACIGSNQAQRRRNIYELDVPDRQHDVLTVLGLLLAS